MRILPYVLAFFILFGLNACKIEPAEINYNIDACFECKMMISDSHFASQIVTDKGKAYKFDAIECLVSYKKKNPVAKFSFVLVCDYMNPGSLIPASQATYLISKNLPSPMGEFISAYSSSQNAKEMQQAKSGKLFSWDELLTAY